MIGRPLRRVEDFRLLTGRGRFSDDRALPGQFHAAFARSPHAHARLEAVQTGAAERLPGVVAVLTAADYAGDGMKPMPAQGNPKDVELVNRDGRPVVYPALAPLAEDRIRRVGEAVAMVVARMEAEALAGAEAVEARYAPLPAYPNGCHTAEVEIDPETGAVRLVRYTAVDDAGLIVNPLLVDGQVHGGVAQGVGQALMECAAYDADGQRIAGSFMDYAVPRADDLPFFEVAHNAVATETNLLGAPGHAAQTVTLSDRPPFGGPAVQPCASAASAPLVIWEKRTGRISSVSKRPPASLVTRSRRWSSSSPAGIAIRPPGLSC